MVETAVKERPILMSTPMVKAILAGKKTQTRRAVKLPPAPNHLGEWESVILGGQGCYDAHGNAVPEFIAIGHSRTGKVVTCPYGQVGDKLWVRETWRIESMLEDEPVLFGYKDGTQSRENDHYDPYDNKHENWLDKMADELAEDCQGAGIKEGIDDVCHWDIGESPHRWKPSIFMPRWASRLTLEITDVKIERVQKISSEDAVAEGIPNGAYAVNSVKSYEILWDKINGKKYPWESNPFVWVVSFKAVK